MSFNGFVLSILASLQAASGAATRTLASARLKDLDRWNCVVTPIYQHIVQPTQQEHADKLSFQHNRVGALGVTTSAWVV